jgi:hypothetical protein
MEQKWMGGYARITCSVIVSNVPWCDPDIGGNCYHCLQRRSKLTTRVSEVDLLQAAFEEKSVLKTKWIG